MFYSIPCVWNMIAAQQADFIGKMFRAPPDWPSCNMITACCDHKKQVGCPQMTGKNFMVDYLRLLFQDVNTVHIDWFGSLRDWIHEASNKQYWNQLVDRLLHPNMPLAPARPSRSRNMGTTPNLACAMSCQRPAASGQRLRPCWPRQRRQRWRW